MLFYIDFGCAFNGHVITMSHIYRAKNQCTTVSCLRICLPFLLSDFGLGAKKKEGREKMLYSSTHFSSKLQIVWQLLIKNFQGREKKLFSDESSFLFPNFSFFRRYLSPMRPESFFPFFFLALLCDAQCLKLSRNYHNFYFRTSIASH